MLHLSLGVDLAIFPTHDNLLRSACCGNDITEESEQLAHSSPVFHASCKAVTSEPLHQTVYQRRCALPTRDHRNIVTMVTVSLVP